MKRTLICTSLVATVLFAGTAFANDQEKFRKMDTDGDGRVTAAEHAAGAQQMFTMMDSNGDGGVTMEEMKMYKDMKRDSKDGMDGDRMRRDGATDAGGMQRDGGN
jgi:Ca2+-binding EF-hand superfamily protein